MPHISVLHVSGLSLFYFIYAALLIVGGVIGFVKAGSKQSLIMGIVMAALMAVAGVLRMTSPAIGLILGAVVSTIVAIVFILRYAKTRKPMPAIPLIVISDLVAIISVIKLVVSHHK